MRAAIFSIALASSAVAFTPPAHAENNQEAAGVGAAASPAAAASATPSVTAGTTPAAAVVTDLDQAVESQARSQEPTNKLEFFAAIVGGVHAETLQTRDDDDSENRTTTIAMSRFGLRGKLAGGVYLESEFEVNAGPHGTSVWEGQAALQVRNQLVRIERNKFRVEAGRLTDDSSLDYFSHHVADQLLTDPYTRAALLASGFNRGQGVLVRYEPVEGLEPGITVNAANPTSTTASLVVGGTFPPFSRFYFAPHQQVANDASGFPSDSFHIDILTPSIIYHSRLLETQAAVQMFRVNTDTQSSDDENIIGYNVRGGAKLNLLDGMVTPFVNASRVTNSVIDPNDGKMLSTEAYVGYTLGGGIDYNYWGNHGVGAQYSFVRGQQGDQSRTTEHFINVGTSYYLTDSTAIGARGAYYTFCDERPGESCERLGARSVFVTIRSLL